MLDDSYAARVIKRDGWALRRITEPAAEPLTIAEVATHLRLDSSNAEPAPGALSCALASPAAPGNVDNGAHRYRVTFVTADGETEGGIISAAVTVADKTANGQVTLTSIPIGGSAVTARKIYRTAANGSTYMLLATVSDNTTATYTDNIADASLGAGAPTTNTTKDPYLGVLIAVARHQAEAYTRRALITQTWDLTLDRFPISSCEHIVIPRPRLQSVTYVQYIDTAGATQTWSSTKYDVDSKSEPSRILPAYGEVYPDARAVMNAVTIRFVAGYGSAPTVPENIKSAMKLIIGHLYEHRETVLVGAQPFEMPLSAEYLLQPHRIFGIY